MIVKKALGRVYGADLTLSERKAMNIEIQKQMAEYDRKNSHEIDAMVLYILHTEFGFGEQRLKKFHNAFLPAIEDLCKRYEMDEWDQLWLCEQKLKDDGIDISKWDV